jgi:hypothetical protein
MDSEVERIYIGLPEELKEKVFWVTRPYRTNPLSHIPGGTDIIVEYHNGEVLGYDWIKEPFNYIREIDVVKECCSNGDDPDVISFDFDLELFKSKVSGIFIRKFKTENHKSVNFEKVWNSKTTTDSPLNAIDNFILQEYL